MNPRFKDFETPSSFRGRTGLQIFVDRFFRTGESPPAMDGRTLKEWSDSTPNWQPEADGVYRNNYFYGGNLQGIISKLDYIENMGFNLLYLSPISFTKSSHHYDVEDQRVIDPWIGNWEDFSELCHKAHERDILIVVDLVFNHMGDNSQAFQEALKSKSSPYRDWFLWDEKGNPSFWFGFHDMPECNKLNPAYQNYACEVATKYIQMGADGIRLDLGEKLHKDFVSKLRKTVKAINPEILIVSEMWGLASEKADPEDNPEDNHQFDGKQVDSIMNYPLADSINRWVRCGNVPHFNYVLSKLMEYPEQVQNVLWNFLDTHDTPRAINMLVGKGIEEDPFKGKSWDIESPWRSADGFDTYAFRKWELENDCIDIDLARYRLMIASTIQYMFPGIPIVYAGTEIGMTGYKDPFNRKPYDWEHPDHDIQEHYRVLGNIRKVRKQFFADRGDFRCEVFERKLKLIRSNSNGTIVVEVARNPNNAIYGWEFDILEKIN